MPIDRHHVVIGPPEVSPTPGAQYRFPQRLIRIDAKSGFADLELRQMDGVVLALDRVAQEQGFVSGTGYYKQPS